MSFVISARRPIARELHRRSLLVDHFELSRARPSSEPGLQGEEWGRQNLTSYTRLPTRKSLTNCPVHYLDLVAISSVDARRMTETAAEFSSEMGVIAKAADVRYLADRRDMVQRCTALQQTGRVL